jgi:hypothetical protein
MSEYWSILAAGIVVALPYTSRAVKRSLLGYNIKGFYLLPLFAMVTGFYDLYDLDNAMSLHGRLVSGMIAVTGGIYGLLSTNDRKDG